MIILSIIITMIMRLGLLPFASLPLLSPPKLSYLRPHVPPPPPPSSSSCSAPGPSLGRPRLSYVITPGLSLALPHPLPFAPLLSSPYPLLAPMLVFVFRLLFLPLHTFHVFLMCLRVAAVAAARSRCAPSHR